MSKKNNKLSISALENAVKENVETNLESSFEWNGLTITVNRFLSLDEVIQFVSTVSDACFSNEISEYMPEVRDYFIRYCVVDFYTNLTLPTNSKRVYPILYQTDLIDRIGEHIDQCQFEIILDAVSDKIEHIAQANIEAMSAQINELYMAFSELQDDISAAFSGVSPEVIEAMTARIASLDEKTIAKTYAEEARKNEEVNTEEAENNTEEQGE